MVVREVIGTSTKPRSGSRKRTRHPICFQEPDQAARPREERCWFLLGHAPTTSHFHSSKVTDSLLCCLPSSCSLVSTLLFKRLLLCRLSAQLRQPQLQFFPRDRSAYDKHKRIHSARTATQTLPPYQHGNLHEQRSFKLHLCTPTSIGNLRAKRRSLLWLLLYAFPPSSDAARLCAHPRLPTLDP